MTNDSLKQGGRKMDAQGFTRINETYSYDHNVCGIHDHRFDVVYTEYETQFIGGREYRVFDNFITNSKIALLDGPVFGVRLNNVFIIQPTAVAL